MTNECDHLLVRVFSSEMGVRTLCAKPGCNYHGEPRIRYLHRVHDLEDVAEELEIDLDGDD